MNIGQRLKYARRCRKMTQAELAEGIGVSRGVITNIEFDKVKAPQPIVTTAICKVLRIEPDWLLYGEGDMDAHFGKTAEEADMVKEINKRIEKLTTEEQVLLLQIIQLIRNKN